MHKFKFSLILSLFFSIQSKGIAVTITFPTLDIVHRSKPKLATKKFKIDWKKVFRPIRIFKRKLSFWLVRLLGVALLLGLIGLAAEKSDTGLEINSEVGGLILVGIFVGSSFLVLLMLLASPVVYLVRLIKQLRWRRRMKRGTSKCYDF